MISISPTRSPSHMTRNTVHYHLLRENVQLHVANESPVINPVDYAIWGALQWMVYHRQSFASVDELKRAIVESVGDNVVRQTH